MKKPKLGGRRQFLTQIAAGTVLAGCKVRPPKFLDMDSATDTERRQGFNVGDLPKDVPTDLEARMREVLAWAAANGWPDVLGWSRLFRGRPFPTDPRDPALYEAIYDSAWKPTCDGAWAPRARDGAPLEPGFNTFAGVRAIHPGRPEFSALYHALASPNVSVAAGAYPSLEQLDVLEDWIFAVAPISTHGDHYALAVLAYEYRPAALTPHRAYDDLVFSRTGIARVGQEPPNYDPRGRCFRNEPRDRAAAKHFAVAPARYGLFLVREVAYDEASFFGYNEKNGDKKRIWLKPERKIFSGDPAIGGASLVFGERHRGEGLRRLATVANLAIRSEAELLPESSAPKPDLSRPPFFCASSTVGDKKLPAEHNTDLVMLERRGSSVLLGSVPASLIRPAMQGKNNRLYFQVTPQAKWRYTTINLLQTRRATLLNNEESDAFIEDRFRGVNANRFNAPRNAPMFINARYKRGPHGIEHISMDEAERVNASKEPYWAALFEDSICDGCVIASFANARSETWISKLPLRPAFSIVTAPDFLPNVAGVDLDYPNQAAAMSSLKIGNTAPLSFTRLAANPEIEKPGGGTAFPPGERRLQETVTSVVGRGPSDERILLDAVLELSCAPMTNGRTGFLPDTSSAFLFPGWDVTYVGNDDPNAQRFLSTVGLGSPFAEDVKLCAAGNGMWPATAPDAARTYQPSLESPEPEGHIAAKLYAGVATLKPSVKRPPPTALPLMDDEIGVHPLSPRGRSQPTAVRRGWDGEYGPYLAMSEGGGPRRLMVDYADIGRVDYVTNALADLFDASILRPLSSQECRRRMWVLRKCIAHADRGREARDTDLWLVAAEKTAWGSGTIGIGLPEELTHAAALRQPQPGIRGDGYFFVFARAKERGNPHIVAEHRNEPGWARNRCACDQLVACQIGQDGLIRAAKIDPNQPPSPLRWS